MGADKNRKRAGEILDRAMEGEPELLDARHVEEMPPKGLGALGEELAARYLESRGYEIVERNYRCCEGEADLVVYDPSSEEVVLVEVKARRGHEPDCYPEEAVSRSKRRRYRRIAHQFIADHYPCPSIRFDVIAVSFDTVSVGEIRHLYGAFDWEAGQ